MVGRQNSSKYRLHGFGTAGASFRLKPTVSESLLLTDTLRGEAIKRVLATVAQRVSTIVQAHEPTDFVPVDLNSGFADPDPRYENWTPPADQVPVAGNGKDSRFIEENMWATKPMRPKRATLGAYATDWEDRSDVTKPKPKLGGTGTWGDFGVKEAAASPPWDDRSVDNGYVEGSPVPRTIEGMNQVLQQRVRAARAKSTAAYANRSPSAVAKDVSPLAATQDVQAAFCGTNTAPNDTVSRSSYHKLIPPHKRKLMAGQTIPAVSPSPEPAKLSQAQNPDLAAQTSPMKAATTIEDAEDALVLFQKRLEDQQKQKEKEKTTVSGNFVAANVAQADQNKNDREMVIINGFHRSVNAALSVKTVQARPPPGNRFVVATNRDGRSASSTTLVNDVETDDEALARKLQATEFGMQDISNAVNMIEQEFNQYKFQHKTTLSKQDFKGEDLYKKLHKVQEIIWKQDMMKLHQFAESKDSLYQMDEMEFQRYYKKVVSAHLAQWDARRGLVEHVVKMQSDRDANNSYTVDELLAMEAGILRAVFNKIYSAHRQDASALNMSLDSECRFFLTEDDLDDIEEAGEQEFDSDGFSLSSDEDDDDDVIFFKGHRRG
ncbi:hypothetical protein DPSP01_006934 [Paraphaeosphaeria sporulosa]